MHTFSARSSHNISISHPFDLLYAISERLFSFFALLIGAVVYGIAISNIVTLMASMQEEDTALRAKLGDVNKYMKARKLPKVHL